MYQAFPFQKFGAGEGRVISVSRTVLAPTEIQLPGNQLKEPVFRVRAKIDNGAVSAYGQSISISRRTRSRASAAAMLSLRTRACSSDATMVRY